ncbi:SDR family oxidoreductase [Alcaligenaceae bacterium]|nr:SDR family oxidoreductase [Alcaligenaceae bacterium]
MTHSNATSLPFNLHGHRILINGAAGGIGQATARLLDAMGANLILSDFNRIPELHQLANTLKHVENILDCDVTCRIAVETIIESAGALDALADTSGICPYDDDWTAPDWNENAFTKVMQINVLGPINLVRAVMPGMIERGQGRIALCGSIAGWTGGLRAGPHYAASKGALHALVRWAAQQCIQHNVIINGVAPGPVNTPMTSNHGYAPEKYPMKRMGLPEEIASAIAYLCSPAASYSTGTIMDVNGGTYFR